MAGIKKNSVLLLICLLLVLWLGAGAVDCVGLTGAGQGGESGNAASSMSATDNGFDLLDNVDVVRACSVDVGQYRPELVKTGIYAVVAVMAVMFSAVVMRLKLCQAVYIPFNFNWIPAYIHKKDGMK